MKRLMIFLCVLVGLILAIRFTCGVFVIQPIGALPEGATIIYWRLGMNTPFIASADGLIAESGKEVSLLGRGVMLGGLTGTIREREIFRLGYMEAVYSWSTGGRKYER